MCIGPGEVEIRLKNLRENNPCLIFKNFILGTVVYDPVNGFMHETSHTSSVLCPFLSAVVPVAPEPLVLRFLLKTNPQFLLHLDFC